VNVVVCAIDGKLWFITMLGQCLRKHPIINQVSKQRNTG
jgi:hypothetical protein